MRKFPKQIIYVLVAVIPFSLIFFNSPFLHGIKLKLMSFAAGSVSVARWPVREAEKLISYRKTWAENRRLRKENSTLKSKLVAFEELSGQNSRYARLLQFRGEQNYTSVGAIVIARDPANWNSSLMIDKGKKDGIRPGMPVVNADGVVGKIAEVSSRSAKVVLVNDSGFSVAAVNRRSRESGLLSGSLTGRCRLFYLADNADIEAGDEIVTSQLSENFPSGIMLGTVTAVSSSGGASYAEVEPAVEASKIEEVLVIKE